MKKSKGIIAVLIALVMVFSFAACSSKDKQPEGTTEITQAVTDENGEAVTDANGQVVTEQAQGVVVTDASGQAVTEVVTNQQGQPVTNSSGQAATQAVTQAPVATTTQTTTKKGQKATTTKKGSKTTTKKSGSTSTTKSKVPQTNKTTAPTTTKKQTPPVKRKITVRVKLPKKLVNQSTYKKDTLIISVNGTSKTYNEMVDLDGSTIEFESDSIAGDVTATVQLPGSNVNKSLVVKAANKSVLFDLSPIDIVQGEYD